MILYLDTSALVKLYALEEGRGVVERAIDDAGSVTTSVVAYAEARAALASKHREGVFSSDAHREAVDALDEDWETFAKSEVSEHLTRVAGDLAEEHALRGFDAIHLASAISVRDASSSEAPHEDAAFLSFDSDLMFAAGGFVRLYEPHGRDDTEDPS